MEMVAGYACIVGIDVHKTMLAVVVRQQSGTQIQYEKRKFGTVRSEIEHLAAWPQHHRVEEVVLESTAQYWRPVWYGLEGIFRLHLTHPLKTRAPEDASGISRMHNDWRIAGSPLRDCSHVYNPGWKAKGPPGSWRIVLVG